MRASFLKPVGLIALLAPVPSASMSQAAAQAKRPDCSAPQYRQLDYWVGNWKVFQTGKDVQVATSRIEKIMGGCAIREAYDSPGAPQGHYEGTSYSSYDRKDGKWHQFYVDMTGSATFYTGGVEGSVMTLIAPGRGGSLQRMTYVPMADGAVRQVGVVSTDGAKTWTAGYNLTYRRQ